MNLQALIGLIVMVASQAATFAGIEPVPVYLGFPAFALECFTMYVFVRTIWLRSFPAKAWPDPAGTPAGRPIGMAA